MPRISSTIKNKRAIADDQFGFRNIRSTVEQIYLILRQVISSIQESNYLKSKFPDVFDEGHKAS